MAQISFFKKHKAPFSVDSGSSLMKSLLEHSVPVASSCQGKGVCGKCRLQITKGMENLSVANEIEIFLKDKFSLERNMRISCQTLVLGDVEVDASYW